MSKQQLQHTVDFNNILDNTAMGNQFLAYLQNEGHARSGHQGSRRAKYAKYARKMNVWLF